MEDVVYAIAGGQNPKKGVEESYANLFCGIHLVLHRSCVNFVIGNLWFSGSFMEFENFIWLKNFTCFRNTYRILKLTEICSFVFERSCSTQEFRIFLTVEIFLIV